MMPRQLTRGIPVTPTDSSPSWVCSDTGTARGIGQWAFALIIALERAQQKKNGNEFTGVAIDISISI